MKYLFRGKMRNLTVAIIFCVLLISIQAAAGWTYKKTGPAEAQWINEESGEIADARSGQPAPDGTQAPNGGSGPVPEGALSVGAGEAGQAEMAQQPGTQGTGDPRGQTTALPGIQETAASETQQTDPPASENPNLVWSNGRWLDLSRPMIALTYDDGPSAANGNRLMDLLVQNNGRATFFLVGKNVPSNRDEVQRMVREGMEVANHSFDHQYFNKLSASAIREQVSRCNAAIYETCGVAPALMRLPGGNINQTVRENVDMPMIYWTIDTRDWEHKNPSKTIGSVLGHVKDGDIVLMHEIWKATVTANETLIPELARQGFQLVTVSELVRFRGYTLGTGTQYVSFPVKQG